MEAPELLAHLDFTSKVIKQEKLDPSDPDNLTITLHPDSQISAMAQAGSLAKPLSVTAAGSQSETMVVTAATARSGADGVAAVPKMLTIVVGNGADAADRKTRWGLG